MKVALLGIAIGTCVGCHAAAPAAPAPDLFALDESRRAVEVSVLCVRGAQTWPQSGSGVLIGPRRVLTANHVTSCAPDGPDGVPVAPGEGFGYFIKTADGRTATGDLGYANPGRDIAEIELDADIPVLPVELARIDVGDDLCVVAANPARTRVCGHVFEILADRPSRDIGHTADTIPGNSGSGVWDMRGHLVGIATRCNSPACNPPNGGHAASVYDAGIVP